MNCQIFSTGLSSNDFGGSGIRVMLSGYRAYRRGVSRPDRAAERRGLPASPFGRFPPDAAPSRRCCSAAGRGRPRFLAPGRWRRRCRSSVSADRAVPRAASRAAPSAGDLVLRTDPGLVRLSMAFLHAILRAWLGESDVILGSGAVLHRSGCCVTLHAVGSYGSPAP